MKLGVIDAAGQEVDEIDVDDLVFGIEPNGPVVHQTLLSQLAARRSGSAHTKSRSEVRGSTRKLRRQKGLGMGSGRLQPVADSSWRRRRLRSEAAQLRAAPAEADAPPRDPLGTVREGKRGPDSRSSTSSG